MEALPHLYLYLGGDNNSLMEAAAKLRSLGRQLTSGDEAGSMVAAASAVLHGAATMLTAQAQQHHQLKLAVLAAMGATGPLMQNGRTMAGSLNASLDASASRVYYGFANSMQQASAGPHFSGSGCMSSMGGVAAIPAFGSNSPR